MGMGSTGNKKGRRIRLFAKQRGLCYWCQVPIKMEPDGTIPTVSRYSATFDHVHPRGHPQRAAEQARACCHIVLACYRCNQKRDQEFQRKAPQHRAAQPISDWRVPLGQLVK